MVANGLSKSAAAGKAEVTILEKKDHVDLCIPHPRSMVNAAFAQEVLFLLSSYLRTLRLSLLNKGM